MERIERSLKGRYWRKVITYFLTCCLFLNTSLPAVMADVVYLPGHVDNRGVITVTPDPDILTKTNMNAEDGAIGHFNDFDIATGHFVDCVQPSADASALFRIFSGDGTQILGRFDANGSVYLIDPAGILFGVGSEINVNRLIASGLNMSNDAFDAARGGGEMVFSGGDGEVMNRGTITSNGVYLIGEKVFNIGPIIAPDGLVVMAAGDQVRLAQDGSDVSVVVSDLGDGYPDIRTSGYVYAPNGTIVLAAGDTFSRAIVNAGFLVASGGTVKLQAATVENRGYILADASTDDGDGGSISLIGADEVVIGQDKFGNASHTFANARVNGNGGTITITAGTDTVEGKVTIEENSLITATGGSNSGNGGEIIITSDNFEIAGDIDASFGNELSGNELGDPGKLVINSSSVIIADGPNPTDLEPPEELVENTLYEEDIENLSEAGTSLIVNAEEGITVKDITDDIGTGEITGRYGSIELHATGENSAVTFDDTTDTIRTTLGDIIIEAGRGAEIEPGIYEPGIKVGNLITAKDSHPRSKPYPGKIMLTTNNGGDIETQNLIIESGSGTAEIDVKASGNLTVNGDVIVGQQGDGIQNVPNGENAHAIVKLSAGDNVVLNGLVGAYAHGVDDDVLIDDITIAEIRIFGNTNLSPTGVVDIKGNLEAEAKASTEGTSEAIIEVDALGNGDIIFADGVFAHAKADLADVQGTESDEDPVDYEPGDGVDHAELIIHLPELEAYDDEYLGNHMGLTIVGDSVLLNDFDPDADPLDPLTAILVTDVEHGTLTLNEDGTYTYQPDPGFVGTDTFWYTARDIDDNVSNPAKVTIELTNELPVANDIGPTETYMNYPVTGPFDYADTPDGEGGPTDFVTVKLVGAVDGVLTTDLGGTVTITKSGDIYTYTYTPPEEYVGYDSFEYNVTDAQGVIGETGQATVKITVKEGEPPKPPTTPTTPALPYIPAAPGIERIEIEISGCPALVKWAAEEIGIDQRLVQIWVANSLASTGNIQPCDACEGLKNAAKILQDADGTHIAALAQVINEFASSTAPPTEEQMASIADAIARNTDADSYYAIADEYLDALATYVGILSSEMGFSAIESVQLVTDKYIGRLAQGQNVGVATFIAASLAALGG